MLLRSECNAVNCVVTMDCARKSHRSDIWPDFSVCLQSSIKVPLPAKLAVGAVAGIIGTSAIFPIDIVKTHLQNQKRDAQGE